MLIGREKESRWLRDRVREGGSFAVVGTAGIGKTTLVRQVFEGQELEYLYGGCFLNLSSMAYLPLARALGSMPDHGDAAAVIEEAIRGADGRPVVLDDLQWSDHESLELIPTLANSTPLALIVRTGDSGSASAIEMIDGARIPRIEPGPLGSKESADLVQRRHPELADEVVRTVVRHSHGNPLLLEQLAEGDAAQDNLRLSLAARLGRQSESARETATMAALLQRPADGLLLGPGVPELLAAGLLVEVPDGLELRHSLLAKAVVDNLSEADRKAAHARLARSVEEPGEAAIHFHEAGEDVKAVEQALVAADVAVSPGERTDHLVLAARCADLDRADDLRLEAADALVLAGRYEEAIGMLELVEARDQDSLTSISLLKGRILGLSRRYREAESEFESGLELVAGSGQDIEVQLLLERLRWRQMAEWGTDEVLALSEEVWQMALTSGHRLPEAERMHAAAAYIAGHERSLEFSRRAYEIALPLKDENPESVFEAAELLCVVLNSEGLWDESVEVANAMIALAESFDMRLRELQFRFVEVARMALFEGRFEEAAESADALVNNPNPLGALKEYLCYISAVCRAVQGRLSEARSVVRSVSDGDTEISRAFMLAAEAEIEWCAQDPGRTVELAELSLEIDRLSPNQYIAWVMLAWGRWDLGLRPEPALMEPDFPALEAAIAETHALAALHDGDARRAAEQFRQAASISRNIEIHSSLRASLGECEALVAAGDVEEATASLLRIESRLEDLKMTPLLGRARDLLAKVGVNRRSARGGTPAGISLRQAEILSLVGAGMTSPEIAARLGIKRSTVDSLVGSAVRALGARNRRQAAMMLAERGE